MLAQRITQKLYKYDRCIHVPQVEMQLKAVNKVIATILLFAVVQTLAKCKSPFINLYQGLKLIMIFPDYHRQDSCCKLILRLSFSPRLTTRHLELYLRFSLTFTAYQCDL